MKTWGGKSVFIFFDFSLLIIKIYHSMVNLIVFRSSKFFLVSPSSLFFFLLLLFYLRTDVSVSVSMKTTEQNLMKLYRYVAKSETIVWYKKLNWYMRALWQEDIMKKNLPHQVLILPEIISFWNFYSKDIWHENEELSHKIARKSFRTCRPLREKFKSQISRKLS